MSMQRHIGKVTSVASITFGCCVRYEIMSVKQSWHSLWRHLSSLALITATTSSPAFPLHRVQNAAARLVLNLDRRSHISPALQQLHWLPVRYRVTFKIATLMHQVLHNRCPSYLVDLVTYNVTDPQRRQLRSSTTRAAVVRRTHQLSLENVHSLSAVLTSGTVFLWQLETLTVIQHSDEHWSRICSRCFFLVTISVHSTDFVMHSRPLYVVGLGTITFYYCIVLYYF